MAKLWNIPNGQELAQLVEGNEVNLRLPIIENADVDLEIISGSLPPQLKLDGNFLKGRLNEVSIDSVFEFVIRAHLDGYFDDRSIKLLVSGPDDPTWLTQEGLLPIGPNDTFFILDNELVEFQLLVEDDDILAGQVLEFYIENDSGVLPPGLQLTRDGRIIGTSEPLLSLDRREAQGGYDNTPYGAINWDYGLRSTNGYSTFFYDSFPYGFYEVTQNLRKLNRYYPFEVTVTDGTSFVKRKFKIYLVGDDFLRADNTIMESSTGVFRADNTHIRSPIWITPRDLGYKRANNYTTIFLDIIEDETLEGTVQYTLQDLNDDGTISELPPGLTLNSVNGELHGYIPYQPAITRNYKFTVNATRYDLSLDTVIINGTFYEDTFIGATSFKIAKIDLTGDIDGINDLQELIGRDIFINGFYYRVVGVNDNDPDFDVIFLRDSLVPKSSIVMFEEALVGQDYLYAFRIPQKQREEYLGRTFNFGTNTDLVVQSIVPMLTYEIKSEGLSQISATTLRDILIENYEKPADILSINFDPTPFYKDYIVEVKENNRWWVTIKENTYTKNLSKFTEYVQANVPSDSTPASVTKVREFFDRFSFDKNLPLKLNQGRNIGLALFRGDSFQERVAITNTDEVVRPSSNKTFELRVIGEIDSNIKWITPPDLGEIKKDLPSLLYVQAETPVPGEPLLYEVTRGNLPPGLTVGYTGNIIGFPELESTDTDELDRQEFKFTVKARDRFNLVAIEREFTLTVIEDDKTRYTAIKAKPMLPIADRTAFRNFMRDPEVIVRDAIYRFNDPEFGVKDQIEMMVYIGIEQKNIEEFVAATAKNHKRKRFKLGSPTKAVAKQLGSKETIYEVIYLPVIDPYMTTRGQTQKSFEISTGNKITVDSQSYAPFDDETNTGVGGDALAIYTRDTVKFVFEGKRDALVIETRDSEISVNTDNNNFVIDLRDTADVSVNLAIIDAETKRLRPTSSNTIKADSDAVKVSQSKDNIRYLSSLEHMRDNIRSLGKTDRELVPLWMRTPQDNGDDLANGAIVLCYCNPGRADEIIARMSASDYDFSQINFEIDRYTIANSLDKKGESFILFANYQFNV